MIRMICCEIIVDITFLLIFLAKQIIFNKFRRTNYTYIKITKHSSIPMHCVGLQLVLLKEIIVIIKIQINLILNTYNLLSKFYHRERERERERELVMGN